ncbi:hypothetical protein [Dysgonomonas massiliensis]|uniref:hypothetical protein n=1 Tax=Dysgonomonas massiliensis TaxID=2040292 RepID=UPI0011AF02EF|nr:hypothetical protein [Dysgonomonas massiliensis]
MIRKEQFIFWATIAYWLIIAICLIALRNDGWGLDPCFLGIIILGSLVMLIVKNRVCNIMASISLFLFSLFSLICVVIATIFFFHGNELTYILLLLQSIINFIAIYLISKVIDYRYK